MQIQWQPSRTVNKKQVPTTLAQSSGVRPVTSQITPVTQNTKWFLSRKS